MKRVLVVGLIIAGLWVAGFATLGFAQGPEGGGAPPTNQGAWEAMYEACGTGDWEAMAEAAEEVHGEDFGYMPHHGYYAPEEGGPYDAWGGMGGHMGGGMMSGGWGGMMGWR